MKILLDALSIRDGGGFSYLRAVANGLRDHVGENRYSILLSRRYQQEISRELPESFERTWVDLPDGALALRWTFQQTRLPALLRRQRYDVLFSVYDIGCTRPPCAAVVTSHNLLLYVEPARFPELPHLKRYQFLRRRAATLTLRAADRVLFVSAALRKVAIAATGVREEKAEVVHHGCDERFSPPAGNERDSHHVLVVSSVLRHKRLDTVIRAAAALKRGGVLAHVTIVGSISDADVLAELKTIALQEGIPEQVTFAGSRPVDELAALYRSATAVVLTSAVESFALPLLEAMASGTAVIASDIPVAREVCGDAAQFYPPGDVDALAASIRRALHDRRWRGDAVARGLARARLFSWQKAALQIGASFIAANAAFSDRRMVLSG